MLCLAAAKSPVAVAQLAVAVVHILRQLTSQDLFGNTETAISMIMNGGLQLSANHRIMLGSLELIFSLFQCTGQLGAVSVAFFPMDMPGDFLQGALQLLFIARSAVNVSLFHAAQEGFSPKVAIVCMGMLLRFFLPAGQNLVIAQITMAVILLLLTGKALRLQEAFVPVTVTLSLGEGAGQFASDRLITALIMAVYLGRGKRCIAIGTVHMGRTLLELADQLTVCVVAMLLMHMGIELSLAADQVPLTVLTGFGVGMRYGKMLLTIQNHEQTVGSAVAVPSVLMLLKAAVGLIGRCKSRQNQGVSRTEHHHAS